MTDAERNQLRERLASLEEQLRGAFVYGAFNHDFECMVLKEAKVGLKGDCTCGFQAWLDGIPDDVALVAEEVGR